ncbi:glycoside hydrolase family 13 protein [Pelomonas sp. SE-A7]|uniref:glycoside hydrolase family 13 protein n=1 Tax=Pelomonas sp. SE-A7 TaxID=3054953 RepID=UPI00259C7886|nr:glycoside hydrolase family 13 protein [Pelomonas sp. SE-A7]MDM4764658.1 glycoside hydrolase family 13 protein [Pelomonas sp. SE-A7]
MRRALGATLVLAALAATAMPAWAGTFENRERDWRNGAVVYQIIVDRFVPSANLEAKRALYPAPKVLRPWSEAPKPGVYLPDQKLNSAELDFWGGDLASAATRLDHIQQLGADVLYLNPIHLAWTNHKYDAFDFQKLSPEYGNREDFKRLASDARQRGLKVVLDGVFNHMGRNAPVFKDAYANPKSPWRHWFSIGPQYEGGALVWTGFQNLPELKLENPAVRRHLWLDKDSVVRSYLRDGADGWRLDTAFELGHNYLRELTEAAHREKPGSLVVGEIANYPDQWLKSIDAVMNFSLRDIILGAASGDIAPATAARMTDRLVRDAGIEPLLKSWVVIDNHDIPRIATQLPATAQRRLVQALQFTLPGAPNLYYGAEVGMVGGTDPENRGPMRWDLVREDNPELSWVRKLIALHKAHRALRIGDFRLIESQQLFAFERHTDKALDTRIVIANPSNQTVRERLMVANAHLMDGTPMIDLLGLVSPAPTVAFGAGSFVVEMPAHSVLVLQPRPSEMGGYSRYKRVQ